MSQESVQPTRQELLAHAARCYRNARLTLDACRCLEGAAEYGSAALIYQGIKNWAEAARCFEQDENWRAAARCHMENRRPGRAARCLIAGGEPLEAGWILAHHAHHYEHARAVLVDLQFDSPERSLALALARGRCDAPKNPVTAGRAVREVINRLNETAPGPDRDRMLDWAFTLTNQVMDRPDLAGALYAAAVEAGVPEAQQSWERWAGERLGSLEGIVAAEEEAI